MRVLGVLDAALMSATVVATALLFSFGDDIVFWVCGAFCLMPWAGQAAASFATGRQVLPVRFTSFGDAPVWWTMDIGVMLLWGTLTALTCIAFGLTVVVLATDNTVDIGFDSWLVAPFGVVVIAMTRVVIPLIVIGCKSSKSAITSIGRGLSCTRSNNTVGRDSNIPLTDRLYRGIRYAFKQHD